MAIFGKNRVGSSKLFPYSRPYGYSPEHVEKAIAKYNETIAKVKEINQSQVFEIERLNAENHNLKERLRKMYLDMNMMEIPSMDESQEAMILGDFKKANNPNSSNANLDENATFDPTELVKDTGDDEIHFNLDDIVS